MQCACNPYNDALNGSGKSANVVTQSVVAASNNATNCNAHEIEIALGFAKADTSSLN